jgi:DNA recombination protein RmuC
MIVLLLIAIALMATVVILQLRTPSSQSQSSPELERRLASLADGIDRLDKILRDEFGRSREETNQAARNTREEFSGSLKGFGDSMSTQIGSLAKSNEERLEAMRGTIESRLKQIQDDNSSKLEQMRATVDEKLQSTLERRLGESFKLVSDRLELVHKGLGEMQTLASGVGDLKKVLTNVKTRGTWGEIQLGSLLEQILAVDQYEANVATKPNSRERVEFAIKMPGRDAQNGQFVWLPIDAKFPLEDYQRLVEAQEQANAEAALEAGKMLELRVKNSARDIKEKYLDPPHTTDFGIMFLPTEGLYAEVLRRPGLGDTISREFRVIIAGPTTLAALLNSLQMGFRTLAIEKRSSEVWNLLAAVKTEFGRFGEVLEKTQKKLQEASNTIDSAATRSRAIEKKLRDVADSPTDAAPLLGVVAPGIAEDADVIE